MQRRRREPACEALRMGQYLPSRPRESDQTHGQTISGLSGRVKITHCPSKGSDRMLPCAHAVPTAANVKCCIPDMQAEQHACEAETAAHPSPAARCLLGSRNAPTAHRARARGQSAEGGRHQALGLADLDDAAGRRGPRVEHEERARGERDVPGAARPLADHQVEVLHLDLHSTARGCSTPEDRR